MGVTQASWQDRWHQLDSSWWSVGWQWLPSAPLPATATTDGTGSPRGRCTVGTHGGHLWTHASGAIPTSNGSTAPYDDCGSTRHVRRPGTCTEQPACCQRPFWRPLKLQVRTPPAREERQTASPRSIPSPQRLFMCERGRVFAQEAAECLCMLYILFLHMPPVLARDDTFHSVALPGPVEQPSFRSPPLRLFSKLGHPPCCDVLVEHAKINLLPYYSTRLFLPWLQCTSHPLCTGKEKFASAVCTAPSHSTQERVTSVF